MEVFGRQMRGWRAVRGVGNFGRCWSVVMSGGEVLEGDQGCWGVTCLCCLMEHSTP